MVGFVRQLLREWRSLAGSAWNDPIYAVICASSLIYGLGMRMRRDIHLAGRVRLKGWPILETNDSGKIYLGSNVTLYSTRRRYFAHLGSPARLYADGGTIRIGDNTRINGATLHARHRIEVGSNCLIAANTSIIDSNGHGACFDDPATRLDSRDESRAVVIEDNVWIGLNCVVLKGVKIGTGAIVAAGSVVFDDVPSYSLVRGNPAAVLRRNC